VRQVSFKGNWCLDFRELHPDRRRIRGYGDDLPDDELMLVVPPDRGVTPEMMCPKVLGRDLGGLRRQRRRRATRRLSRRRLSGILGPGPVIAEVLHVVAGAF
jgi:hypothetical protein